MSILLLGLIFAVVTLVTLVIGGIVLVIVVALVGLLANLLSVIPLTRLLFNRVSDVFLSVFFLLLGWAFFSFVGLVPSFLALPLPYHYEYQVLPTATANVQQEFEDRLDVASVPAGAFDELNESSKHQANLRAYQDGKGALFFMSSAKDRPYRWKDKKMSSQWSMGWQMGLMYGGKWLTYRVSGAYRGHTTIEQGSLKKMDVTYYDGVQRTVDAFVPDYLAELLARESTEMLTPRELAVLLESRVWGQLAGWFPETGAALIYDGTQVKGGELRVYDVTAGTYRVAAIPEGYTLVGCVSDQVVACYTPDGHLVMCDVDAGPLKATFVDSRVLTASIYRDDDDGSVYLGMVTTRQDGTEPHSVGFRWIDGDLNAMGELIYNDLVNESWNWQEADVFCMNDVALAVFPEEGSINYLSVTDPWE